ncbi:hypothetical protein [Rubritalea tangerina]
MFVSPLLTPRGGAFLYLQMRLSQKNLPHLTPNNVAPPCFQAIIE